ncbi:MAG: alkaline phosphatase [Isosphaeraceae bacterium]
MSFRLRPRLRTLAPALIATATAASLLGLAAAQGPAAGGADPLKQLQSTNVAAAKKKVARAYHFGSQGPVGPFSNHGSHSNRLIPFYTFGSKLDPALVTGKNSIYRDARRLEALYGFLPENTVNPDAEYADQSDMKRLMDDAVAKGVKHLFIVWFDGMDWDTTRAAAVAKTGEVYDAGKGRGLVFQDYDAKGTAKFGYYVTSPTHDKNEPDVDAQTVKIPSGSTRGGYDPQIAGPNPWTPGPLAAKAPGYLKGQSGDARDKAGVAAAGRVPHAYSDSSCTAAAFVSGRKAYNNGVNVTDDGTFVPTVFHQVQAKGWGVGTVTSVPFPHASPAAMYAHNVDRDDYQDLARDMLGLESVTQKAGKEPVHPGLDVVMGAGFGQEVTGRGLEAQGKNVVPGNLYIAAADLAAIDVKNGGKYVVAHTEAGASGSKVLADAAAKAAGSNARLFGLFGSKSLNHLPYRTADGRYDPPPDLNGKAEKYTTAEVDEQPTLADMTRAALTVLTAKPGRPFALFIEAGDVDFALHANNLDNAVGAVYSGEAAIRAVIDWVESQSNWDDSAMIVAADHGHYLVIDDAKAIAGAAKTGR